MSEGILLFVFLNCPVLGWEGRPPWYFPVGASCGAIRPVWTLEPPAMFFRLWWEEERFWFWFGPLSIEWLG